MTRINLQPPIMLTDQHLIAEKKEINQLAGQLRKSMLSKNYKYNDIPSTYRLGTGHVKFWYTRGKFIRERYRIIYEECIRRGFSVVDDFHDYWLDLGPKYNIPFTPTDIEFRTSYERIRSKILNKPSFYRYYSEYIDINEYFKILLPF